MFQEVGYDDAQQENSFALLLGVLSKAGFPACSQESRHGTISEQTHKGADSKSND